jgi:hypothetical protein
MIADGRCKSQLVPGVTTVKEGVSRSHWLRIRRAAILC